MVLNIAEGAGEYRPKEKARFYRMSRRSADEASTALDLLVDVEVLTAPSIAPVQQKIERAIGGLVRLIQSQERRAGSST
jgi:four helix bundle protein